MRRRIRRGVQALELDAKVTYQVGLIEVGVMTLINRKSRGREDTEVNLLFDHQDVQEALEQIHCYPGSEFTSMDIMKIVRRLNKRGRMRFRLQLPYPPPSVAKAWQRAHDRIDMWLTLDLAPKPKEVQLPAEVPEAPTVAESWAVYWAKQGGPNSSLEAEGTKNSQDGYWRNWIRPEFGHLRTNEVSAAALEKWRDDMANKVSANYVLLIWRLFKRFFVWLEKQDKQDMYMGLHPTRLRQGVSPFSLAENPKRPPKKERRTYSEEQLLSLLTACKVHDPTLLPIMVTAISTGMRIGEILGLKWQDIYLADENGPGHIQIRGIITREEGYVKRGKTKNALRPVPLSSVLQDTLVEFRRSGLSIVQIEEKLDEVKKLRRQKKRVPKHLRLKPRPVVRGQQQEDFIFINYAKNSHLDYGPVQARLRKIKEHAGIEHLTGEGWHEFRHAFISWAMKRKVDIKHLQLSVGHSDMKTTLGYTHLVGADSSWVNDLFDFDDHPVVNLGEKTTPKVITVKSEKLADNGVQVGCAPFVPVIRSHDLQVMTAFIEKTKESGWASVEHRHLVDNADDFQFANRFLWHIRLILEDCVSRLILHPVSRGES